MKLLSAGRMGLASILALVFSIAQAQQQPTSFSKDRKVWTSSQRDSVRRVIAAALTYPSWIFNSNFVLYQTTAHSGLKTFYIADPEHSKSIRLFDGNELVELSSAYLPKSVNPIQVDFSVQGVSKTNPNILLCSVQGTVLQYDLKKGVFTEPIPGNTTSISRPINPMPRNDIWTLYTKDRAYGIYAENHNLFLKKSGALGKDSVVQLNYDGNPNYSFARKTVSNQKRGQRGPWLGEWLGDTHIGFALRSDQRKVRDLSLINSLALYAPVRVDYKYELPGDEDVTQYELWLLNADSAKMRQVNIDRFPDQEVKMNQNQQSGGIYFTRESRTVDTIQLCRVDPYTFKTTVLIAEVGKPILNDQLQTYTVINEGKEVIWWSERTGKGAYYLYDQKGKLKNAITKGDFVAGNIVHLDTNARYIILEGFGYKSANNPYHKKFYKVNLDGSGFVELTPGQGDHATTLSLDKKFIIDRYSSVDSLPKCEIRDMKGKVRASIPMLDHRTLKDYGLNAPILQKVEAADHVTDLYGIIYTPADFDPHQKYPVICNVYPGPQVDGIPLGFDIARSNNEKLADLGFIVLQFGYRGSSPLRGRDFYTFGHGNLRDYALADCKYVVEQLAASYSYMDLDRVGIYGHSGGGFMTAAAMLTYPDFFKVGVSSSGNHDNNIYGKFWTETYQGVEQTKPTTVDSLGRLHASFVSSAPTNIELAKNLKGRLLLVTGDMDNNVHPANTIRLANALIKNNKRFDLMILPGIAHEVSGDYYSSLISNYFVDHLKNWKGFDVNMVK
ncbi:Dipeptidyl aminopeptidase/acylaminoacyl peptidase [Pedobacter terrae]|uniref:Dipeptidyl aminopeptidase/acylaminoacyl peptidase n=1 Tax=Pedobacter terrae TaxID=405671 RepID=A0A1G7PYJ7_9SPHI|nr:prolyl oligopeptidase family serine peptidase [Pedobacter terrae]SDF91278.1 Dipeptidyl aminopeptidase/acylaminoacyl peptidase [Pedobacter terrae]